MLLCAATVLKPNGFVSFQAKVMRGARRKLPAPKSRAAQSVWNQEQTHTRAIPEKRSGLLAGVGVECAEIS
jgi:hypothetical protein